VFNLPDDELALAASAVEPPLPSVEPLKRRELLVPKSKRRPIERHVEGVATSVRSSVVERAVCRLARAPIDVGLSRDIPIA